MASFKETIGNADVKKPAASKSSVPVIPDVPESVKTAAAAVIDLKATIAQKEADLLVAETSVSDFCRDIQDRMGFKGMYSKSYAIPLEGSKLTFTMRNVFKINPASEADIRETLGEDYNDLIQENITVTLKKEVLESEALTAELEKLLGDNFSKFFEATKKLTAKEDFDKNIFKVVKTEKKLAYLRTLVEPTKASLK